MQSVVYAARRICIVVMLSVVIGSVIVLNFVMVGVVKLCHFVESRGAHKSTNTHQKRKELAMLKSYMIVVGAIKSNTSTQVSCLWQD